MSEPSVQESLLSAKEAAAAFNVPVASVWRAVRLGRLPAIHIGKSVRFSEASLNEWIRHGEAPLDGVSGDEFPRDNDSGSVPNPEVLDRIEAIEKGMGHIVPAVATIEASLGAIAIILGVNMPEPLNERVAALESAIDRMRVAFEGPAMAPTLLPCDEHGHVSLAMVQEIIGRLHQQPLAIPFNALLEVCRALTERVQILEVERAHSGADNIMQGLEERFTSIIAGIRQRLEFLERLEDRIEPLEDAAQKADEALASYTVEVGERGTVLARIARLENTLPLAAPAAAVQDLFADVRRRLDALERDSQADVQGLVSDLLSRVRTLEAWRRS